MIGSMGGLGSESSLTSAMSNPSLAGSSSSSSSGSATPSMSGSASSGGLSSAMSSMGSGSSPGGASPLNMSQFGSILGSSGSESLGSAKPGSSMGL